MAYLVMWFAFSRFAILAPQLRPWQIGWIIVGVALCLFAGTVRVSDPCHGDHSGSKTNSFWSLADGR
jgi:hypothetical protein